MLSSFDRLRETIAANLKLLDVLPEDCDTSVENVTVEAGGNKTTPQGLWFASLRYRGVVFLDNFPSAQSGLLFCLIKAYLDSLEREEDLEAPEFDFIDLANGRRNVEISVNFRDKLFLAESENGPIEINGKRYDAVPFDLWVAERADIGGGAR